MRRVGLTILWLSFIGYAFLLAPPDQPDTADLILKLSTGSWEGINPAIVALFNIMGIWPMVYASVALIDGTTQKAKAWPFVAGSFAVGAFAILPYLIWRTPNANAPTSPNWILRLVDSRWLGVLLLVASLVLVGFGLIAGDWSDFGTQWRTSRFIHVMSLDFCLLWALFPALLKDDMARRGWHSPAVFWAAALVPLVGASAYLAVRPSLTAERVEATSTP